MHINRIKDLVNGYHPRRPVADMSFLHALRSTSNLQVKKNIKPIVLDFDQTGRKLTVVDRGFLIWLQHQDRAALLRSSRSRSVSASRSTVAAIFLAQKDACVLAGRHAAARAQCLPEPTDASPAATRKRIHAPSPGRTYLQKGSACC